MKKLIIIAITLCLASCQSLSSYDGASRGDDGTYSYPEKHVIERVSYPLPDYEGCCRRR